MKLLLLMAQDLQVHICHKGNQQTSLLLLQALQSPLLGTASYQQDNHLHYMLAGSPTVRTAAAATCQHVFHPLPGLYQGYLHPLPIGCNETNLYFCCTALLNLSSK